MSVLSQFITHKAVRSVQTGWVASAPSVGSGADVAFVNVTISSVSAGNCLAFFQGGYANGGFANEALSDSFLVAHDSKVSCTVHARVTGSTTLRLGCSRNYGGSNHRIAGRWTVVEFEP